MAREFQRSERVADAIQRSLSNIIRLEIRDPRIGMVNINSVTITRDLAYAKVYVTFVGVDEDAEGELAAEVLNNAASFLRTQLAKDIKMRVTPKLQFIYDTTSVRGQELSQLIDEALESDKQLHKRDLED